MKPTVLRITSRVVRSVVPSLLIFVIARPRSSARKRLLAFSGLVGIWSYAYRNYRARGRSRTAREHELLRTATLEAFSRHYNERVPTIEEEFDIWGDYHQHRHEMRYDLLADTVRAHAHAGAAVLDVGCGSVLVADRILDLDATYVGLEFGGHHISYARDKLARATGRLKSTIICGDGEALPFPDESFDVLVMSEVIEHLMQPERAVWEVARVLKPGGVFIMTTNNASEVPLYSPLSHLFAWLEKGLGAEHPQLISLRPWIWPEPIDPELLPEGTGPVYLPHTHHIMGETRDMFTAAGLETIHWSSFEFPPPQAATARWLDARGAVGKQVVDVIEAICRHTPFVRRLGCHLFMVARKVSAPVAEAPPPGIWPGPFSAASTPGPPDVATEGQPSAISSA